MLMEVSFINSSPTKLRENLPIKPSNCPSGAILLEKVRNIIPIKTQAEMSPKLTEGRKVFIIVGSPRINEIDIFLP